MISGSVTATALVALAIFVAVAALLVALRAWTQTVSLRRRLAGTDESDVVAELVRQRERVADLGALVAEQRRRVDSLDGHTAAGLRHVAVVRYDAFGDVGGRLSFSAAMLDDAGDGLVLSSIHARGESRTYAKGIVGGAGDVTLTPEEQQALAAARADRVDA